MASETVVCPVCGAGVPSGHVHACEGSLIDRYTPEAPSGETSGWTNSDQNANPASMKLRLDLEHYNATNGRDAVYIGEDGRRIRFIGAPAPEPVVTSSAPSGEPASVEIQQDVVSHPAPSGEPDEEPTLPYVSDAYRWAERFIAALGNTNPAALNLRAILNEMDAFAGFDLRIMYLVGRYGDARAEAVRAENGESPEKVEALRTASREKIKEIHEVILLRNERVRSTGSPHARDTTPVVAHESSPHETQQSAPSGETLPEMPRLPRAIEEAWDAFSAHFVTVHNVAWNDVRGFEEALGHTPSQLRLAIAAELSRLQREKESLEVFVGRIAVALGNPSDDLVTAAARLQRDRQEEIRSAVAAERDACAQIADAGWRGYGDTDAPDIAASIRARSSSTPAGDQHG